MFFITAQLELSFYKNYKNKNRVCGELYLFSRFLDEVQSYSGVNKMSVQNLATVFGPNILRPKIEDPVAIMEGLVTFLLSMLPFHRSFDFSRDHFL